MTIVWLGRSCSLAVSFQGDFVVAPPLPRGFTVVLRKAVCRPTATRLVRRSCFPDRQAIAPVCRGLADPVSVRATPRIVRQSFDSGTMRLIPGWRESPVANSPGFGSPAASGRPVRKKLSWTPILLTPNNFLPDFGQHRFLHVVRQILGEIGAFVAAKRVIATPRIGLFTNVYRGAPRIRLCAWSRLVPVCGPIQYR